MRAFQFLTEKEYITFELPNGKWVNLFPHKYSAKVDLTNEMYILESDEEEYETSTLPTFNDLVSEGIVKVVSCIERKYDINNIPLNSSSRDFVELDTKTIKKILKEFKDNGFNVTQRALIHNFSAWLGDMKSGYRDEENGYFLFTPCGCNPLSFRATTLHPKCADWQITYEC